MAFISQSMTSLNFVDISELEVIFSQIMCYIFIQLFMFVTRQAYVISVYIDGRMQYQAYLSCNTDFNHLKFLKFQDILYKGNSVELHS